MILVPAACDTDLCGKAPSQTFVSPMEVGRFSLSGTSVVSNHDRGQRIDLQRMIELEDHQTEMLPIAELTAEIVGAYVAHHTVAATELPVLIATVGQKLGGLGQLPVEPEEEKPEPAVPIKKSVTPDHVICLEAGKKLKMLKRHLKTRYDMTPEDYRHRLGLKDDYPMVAPTYAATRSALAKKFPSGEPRG